MPVHVKHEVRRLTQHEFSVVAYQVMGTLFEIHEDLGRLFDEGIYQRELHQHLPELHSEVPIEVTFDAFSKTYYLDVLFHGAIFELKAVEMLAPRHRSQLLNYLLLTDAEHGKLVNMRPQRIQHEFVNTGLVRTDRTAFDVHDHNWSDCGAINLKVWLIELLRNLGVGLDLKFYQEAALHYCGPAAGVIKVEICGAGGSILGHQEQPLLSPEVALRISAIDPDRCVDFEHQLRCFLRHTSLKALQWINLTRPLVTFKTLS
ncbi:MAG: GxxExxY protein [Planctomycetota bacterium]